MNARIADMRDKVLSGHYNQYRKTDTFDLHQLVDCTNISWERQVTLLLQHMVNNESAVIEASERIVFVRTTQHPINPVPEEFIVMEKDGNEKIGNRVHNICADWEMMLHHGILGRKKIAQGVKRTFHESQNQSQYLQCVIDSLDAVASLAEKYQQKAKHMNCPDVEQSLQAVLEGPPKSFYQALQSLRFLQGVLWMNGHNHIGFGRFDQYMWPYLEQDLDHGVINTPEAEELLAEFLLSVNKDTDVYPGIQKGDNGQSLVLGGVTKNGENAVNPLTYMVLKVDAELGLPDPKINLRVDSQTELDLLSLAAYLTQKGMGFPQFSNDEVVIPALVHNGYDLEDARDYVIAACWEYIIPGKGMDVPNINALSLPAEVDTAIREGLAHNWPFSRILVRTGELIEQRIFQYVDNKKRVIYWPPAPLFSSYMTNCIEQGLDINSGGAKYCNYGIHGSGCANAADALAAVQYIVYDQEIVDGKTFLNELENNWGRESDILEVVKTQCPKVGNNDPYADRFLTLLYDFFYEACKKASNCLTKNGKRIRIRAGTGSAMFFLWLTKRMRDDQLEPVLKATADGRREGDYISANLAPSIGVKAAGPISCLQSFSKINYINICNGGPITMDILPSSFKGEYGKIQIMNLVKIFIHLHCQQLQLNMVSIDDLKKAQVHPELYQNLIVRVWGWSARFCELDKEFQDHLIKRQYLG